MAKRGRPLPPEIQELLDRVKTYRVNDSFFVAGATRSELEFLRRPCLTQGTPVSIQHVELDEIYQQPGVRVWRKEGAYDEL